MSECLFCFTYDKQTGTFQVQEVISFGKSQYNTSGSNGWFPKAVLFDTDNNCIYACFQNQGGMQRIVLEDWNAEVGNIRVAEHARIMADGPSSNFLLLGEDGNLYYASSADLKMLPLNLTEADWAEAGKVDAMILALGNVTANSQTAITAAREAYEALDWRYKALIQNMEVLQEAESDVLECRIDAIGGNITADMLEGLQEMMDTYASLNSRQQRYVKNYSALEAAYAQATELNEKDSVVLVDGKYYKDTADAIEAIQNANADTVVKITGELQLTGALTTAAAITVNEGAVLDLNGKNLSAKSVVCTGTGVVTDSTDGTGLIKVTAGAVVNADSTHLALYDSREGAKGYRVYSASIVSYQPTFANKTDAADGVKFWFTLNFTNKDAYGAIATGDSQLAIKGTWSVDTRELEFPSSIVKAWAAAQSNAQAGQTYALYVIVTGMDQVDSLTITPKVGALSATAIEYTEQ